MLDGARNAFLGYMYQLVGTAVVSVREVASSADAWAQLIARVGQGVVVSEEFGQDAVAHPAAIPGHGVTAIQFKHSSAAGNLIERDELIDILVAFDRSRREAELAGVTIEHYALVTNRSLDPRAQKIVDNRASPTPHHLLTVVTSRKGEPVAANVKRLEPHQGNAAFAAAAWHTIVRSLIVFPGITFEADIRRLRCFAARYGVLDQEWERCLNALVGAFVRETAEGGAIEVTRDWLKEHLIGDREAANLQFGSPFSPHISVICRDRLSERAGQQHRIGPALYLERRIQQELAAELQQHPIVFVAGGGGRGKSLAVVSYLLTIAGSQVVWSEGSATAGERELVGALTAARLPSRRHGGIDQCLRDVRARLDVANAADRPLWTIDLDGIDEAPDRRSQIRELINLCWAQGLRDASPASLVVTCRSTDSSRERENLIARWLETPEPELVRGVGVLFVGDFVDQELVDAARLLNGTSEQRIIKSLSPFETAMADRSPLVPAEVLQALRHPVVWGGYASLPELDRNGVLDQQPGQLALLAARLHHRFHRRCLARRRWRDERMLENTLPAVARSLSALTPHRIEAWDQGCEACLDRTESRELYAESLSYGIIERDGRDWRWSHPFLAGYLESIREATVAVK